MPLFVSRRVMPKRKLPRAVGPWALDSGGFSELSLFGGWQTTPAEYAADVRRLADEVGNLQWASQQDWMNEPKMNTRTGLSVLEHQRRTVENFLDLRQRLGALVIPVLQGYEHDDYLRCFEMFERAGVDLRAEPTVGLGTMCRRQDTESAARVVTTLHGLGLRLHGFGVKLGGLVRFGYLLQSSDSMAWSFGARYKGPIVGHTHKTCANCFEYAMNWRRNLLRQLSVKPTQTRLAVA